MGGLGAAALRRDPKLLLRPGAFGAQTLAIGVVGEYLHAVLRQVQGQPDYVVKEQLGTPFRPLVEKERIAS